MDEYLQQVHQSITATAVQQAQRSTAAAFEQFMDRCLHSQWEEVSQGQIGKGMAAALDLVGWRTKGRKLGKLLCVEWSKDLGWAIYRAE